MELLSNGIFLVTLGGVLNGIFVYPMKLVRRWEWENIWFLFGLFGLVLFPLIAAWLSVARLWEIYRLIPLPTLAAIIGLGFCWGIGSVLFGFGVSTLGISLGYSVVMATTAILGTIIPAFWLEHGSSDGAKRLVGSLVLILAGLNLYAIAGKKREQMASSDSSVGHFQMLAATPFKKGLLICLLSGLLSACFNIGFALTTSVSRIAERLGATPVQGSYAVWVVILGAGFVPNLFYCIYLFRRNNSFSLFRVRGRNWFYGAVMGILWLFAVELYSAGAYGIGPHGAAVGWPILISSSIIGANVLGLLTGEWRGVGWRVATYLSSGLASLILAVVLAGSARMS